jgi:hypothetical protein
MCVVCGCLYVSLNEMLGIKRKRFTVLLEVQLGEKFNFSLVFLFVLNPSAKHQIGKSQEV